MGKDNWNLVVKMQCEQKTQQQPFGFNLVTNAKLNAKLVGTGDEMKRCAGALGEVSYICHAKDLEMKWEPFKGFK